MNVDTATFQALTARVEAIERELAREGRILELIRGAATDDAAGGALTRQAERENRHLRMVK